MVGGEILRSNQGRRGRAGSTARLLAPLLLALMLLIASCGGETAMPSSYVGIFKTIRTSNESQLGLTITADDGVSYEGSIDTFPVKGNWGEPVSDSLGLTSYQLNKGVDMNFIDFYLSIAGTNISGTALRQ